MFSKKSTNKYKEKFVILQAIVKKKKKKKTIWQAEYELRYSSAQSITI